MAEVKRSLDEVAPAPSVVTIGVFDGVHRGHRAIIGRAVREAEARGVRSVAVTFDPHPMSVVRPEAVPPQLQPLDGRVEQLAAQGVDVVLVLPFTAELSQLSPADFVETVLVEPLRAARVVVGTNFRFGHRAAGDVVVLNDLGALHGFGTEAVALLQLGDVPLSSTEVRGALARGDVAWAAEALGRPWELVGEVVRGDGRGRTIGVPTANVVGDPGTIRPAGGVYAGRARVDGALHDCVVNVGTRPTFDGTTTTVEAHLLDVDMDLYGQRIGVAFVDRVRDERRFDGPDELVAQIRADVEAARGMLAGG